jgi:hypothetical protein
MSMKSVSALFIVLGGLMLIAFETSFYGALPVAAAPQTRLAAVRQVVAKGSKTADSVKARGTYGTIMREGSG